MSRDEPTAATPSRVALSIKGWRCFLGFHRWRLRSVVHDTYLGGPDFWHVYQECVRCGEERSHHERNRRVAKALEEVVHGR